MKRGCGRCWLFESIHWQELYWKQKRCWTVSWLDKVKRGTTKPEAVVCQERQGHSKYVLVYGTVHEWVYLGNIKKSKLFLNLSVNLLFKKNAYYYTILRLKLSTVGTRGNAKYGETKLRKLGRYNLVCGLKTTKALMLIACTKLESKRDQAVTIRYNNSELNVFLLSLMRTF